MKRFEFVLKDNNQKAFRTFFWFLFFLHIISACIVSIRSADKKEIHGAMAFLCIYAVFALLYYIFRKTKYAFSFSNYFLSIVYFTFWNHYLGLSIIILVVVMSFAIGLANKKSIVIFYDDHIAASAILGLRKYDWQQLDNVVLKDNLLTLDFKNNKLLQLMIAAQAPETNEATFNDFCKKALQK
jgi:hypothetical protein